MKIGIIMSYFEDSKRFFKKIEKVLNFLKIEYKSYHGSDLYELKTQYFIISALSPSDRICGYRFNHVIVNSDMPEEMKRDIVAPIISTKNSNYSVTILNTQDIIK